MASLQVCVYHLIHSFSVHCKLLKTHAVEITVLILFSTVIETVMSGELIEFFCYLCFTASFLYMKDSSRDSRLEELTEVSGP